MVCQGIIETMGTGLNWADFLVFPTTCFYHFYSIIFFMLFIVLTFFLFNRERELLVKADLVSCMGVSATAILFLSVIATLIRSTNDSIPMLQGDILTYIIAIWIIIAGFWIFKPSGS